MNRKAVVIDLDGTLLRADKTVSERNLRALQRAHACGMRLIIATARPPRSVKRFLPESLLSICSFVTYNGAIVECRQTGHYTHHPIPAELSKAVLDAILQLAPDADVSLEVEDVWYSLKSFDDAAIWQAAGGGPTVLPRGQLERFASSKIIVSGLDAAGLEREFGARLHVLTTDGGQLIQVSSRLASKEAAVAELCRLYGIPPEEAICFGDDSNDIGLFRLCGWPVAMGNAIPALKELAKEVTASNEADGVALVLERVMEEALRQAAGREERG